jgi:hypothetical protein
MGGCMATPIFVGVVRIMVILFSYLFIFLLKRICMGKKMSS